MAVKRSFFINIREAFGIEGSSNIENKKVSFSQSGIPTYNFDITCTTCDKKSVNGLILSEEELKWAITQEFVTERLRNKSFFGELDHPDPADKHAFNQVTMKNIAGRYNNFYFANSASGERCMKSNVDTLANTNGQILNSVIEANGNIACSMRGGFRIESGDTRQFKYVRMTTYDFIYIPSNRESWGDIESIKELGVRKFANNSYRAVRENRQYKDIFQNIHNILIPCDSELLPSCAKEDILDVAESIGSDFKPTHIIINKANNRQIGYMDEHKTASTIVSESAANDMNKLLRNLF